MIFDLWFHFCLERYFIQTSGQMPGSFILQIAGSWLSWWVRVMLIPPFAFSSYLLQKEMWTPHGHPYLLHWGLVSHQEGNECRGKHCQERTSWLSSSSARHPLNISSKLFFCFPWRCAFSSATISPRVGRKTKTLKNGPCAYCCSLFNSNDGGRRQKVLGAYSLHLCSWGGGEGSVRHGLRPFPSNHCYSPAATMAHTWLPASFQMLVFSKLSRLCFLETLLSCPGRDSAAAPQQATCTLLQKNVGRCECPPCQGDRQLRAVL